MTHQNIFKFQGNPAAGLPWDLEKIGGLGGLVWNIEIFGGLTWNLEKNQGNPASGLPRWTGYNSNVDGAKIVCYQLLVVVEIVSFLLTKL